MQRITLFSIARLLTILLPVLLLAGSALADGAMCIIGALFLAHSWQTKDWQWARARWLHCLLLLWLYMLIRSLFAEFPAESLHRSLPFARYFIFSAALAFWVFQDAVTRLRFIQLLTVVIGFLALDGLLQYLTGYDIFLRPTIVQPDGNLRLTGPFHSPLLGIMLTWLSFPACLWLLTSGRQIFSRHSRLFAVIFSLLVLVVIAFTGERMALLLALMGWGLAIALASRYRKVVVAVTAAGVALLAVLFMLLPALSARQGHATVHTITNWKESPYGLLLTSDLAVAAINPVFGIGPNHFRIVCPTLYKDAPKEKLDFLCNIHPHNIYLEWLIEEGIIGFVLFLGFIAMIARLGLKAWPEARIHPVFIGALIAVTVRLWPLAPSTGFFSRWGAPPFWLMLGLLLVYIVPVTPKPLAKE